MYEQTPFEVIDERLKFVDGLLEVDTRCEKRFKEPFNKLYTSLLVKPQNQFQIYFKTFDDYCFSSKEMKTLYEQGCLYGIMILEPLFGEERTLLPQHLFTIFMTDYWSPRIALSFLRNKHEPVKLAVHCADYDFWSLLDKDRFYEIQIFPQTFEEVWDSMFSTYFYRNDLKFNAKITLSISFFLEMDVISRKELAILCLQKLLTVNLKEESLLYQILPKTPLTLRIAGLDQDVLPSFKNLKNLLKIWKFTSLQLDFDFRKPLSNSSLSIWQTWASHITKGKPFVMPHTFEGYNLYIKLTELPSLRCISVNGTVI